TCRARISGTPRSARKRAIRKGKCARASSPTTSSFLPTVLDRQCRERLGRSAGPAVPPQLRSKRKRKQPDQRAQKQPAAELGRRFFYRLPLFPVGWRGLRRRVCEDEMGAI